MEYLLRLTKLPTTDMLFNKWKEGTGTKTNKQPKFLRGMERQASCHRSRGFPGAHPKLISLALLWSAGQWGNKEGE